MSTAPLYNRVMLLVMLLGIAAYAAAAPALMLAIFAMPVAYIGWRLSLRPGRPARLPTFAVNLLLFAAVAFAIYRTVTHGFEITYIAELVVFLTLIKTGDRRGPRDDAHILFLTVFLAIAAMLTSNTLWVGVLLTLFLPCLVAAVMLFQIHKGPIVAGLVTPGAEATRRSARRDSPAQLALFTRHFRRTAAFGTLGTLLAALVVFVIMPRGIGENAFGNWGNPQRNSVTGFTDRVSHGSRGVISTSPTVVLDLTVREYSEDGASLPLGSLESVYYLRGAVLDVYENGEWRPSSSLPGGGAKSISANIELPAGREHVIAAPSGPLLQQTIALRNARGGRSSTRLFALWRPVRFEIQKHSRITLYGTDGIIELSRGEPGPLTYTVWSSFVDPQRSPPTERTPTSFDSAPIHDLASRILAEANIDPDPNVRPISEDSRAARIIQDFLRANFEYSLDEQYVPSDVHPIEHFLFQTRRGHCEYYASAMAAMCRSVGIYTRIITGYVAAEYNSTSGHYTVRESNAHAWVEAEAGRNLWRRFDPTPQSDLVRLHRPAQTFVSRLRQMIDAIEFAWNTSVVGFDAGRRERLLRTQMVRDSQLVQRIDSITANSPLGGQRSVAGLLGRLALVFLTLALPASALFILWHWIRHFLPLLGRQKRRRRRADRSVEFYQQYLTALARRGHPKPDWSPPLTHAQNLRSPDLAAPAADLARLYYQARFAGRTLSPGELEHARQLIARIARPAAEAQAENA
jgi:protein-glutamine gamma-glutamyltransferase